LALLMYGLMPPDVDFKHNAAHYQTIRGRRSTPEEEFARQAHVVAFFVPQGAASDSTMMASLSNCLRIITVEHKRKAIVIISHADEVPAEDDRKIIQSDICQALSIDSSSVFFLENYIDTKDKQFLVDKNVLRILLAMVSRADDFLKFDRLNPIMCPFERNPHLGGSSTYISSPPQSPSPAKENTRAEPAAKPSPKPSPKVDTKSSQGKGSPAPKAPVKVQESSFIDDFIEKLPEALRDRMRIKLDEEAIDDEETLRAVDEKDWKDAGFKIGDIKKIQKVLQEE